MASNPGRMLRSTSPASLNESSHRSRRLANVQNESLNKDKNFRRYAAGVDRVLGLFDTALQEWADYISFLSRLQKALQNHPKNVSIVPSKLIVAKRLAQCLHPRLPSGVHQRALDLYRFIFAFIGADGLAEDLGLYLPGVATTLTFASISVRPLFLSLIEDHVLTLPTTALRPALKALILTLLPGLEEETSDEFERVLQMLNHAKLAFTSTGMGEVFWQNLFLASITSSSRRQGALVYLSRHLPKLGEPEADLRTDTKDKIPKSTEIAVLTTPEPGLLLRCFATGLADSQGLVQRGFLDLLVTHLPLYASMFRQQAADEDLELLVSAAVGVVLKRDMSLNRRLWSWFLGTDLAESSKSTKLPPADQVEQSDKQRDSESLKVPSYFEKYGAKPLIMSLTSMIAHKSCAHESCAHKSCGKPCAPLQTSRPFRIALSLMDRWEIGGPIVNAIFLPLLRSLWAYRETAPSEEAFDEVFRSANVFFDGVESKLIWSKLLSLVNATEKSKENILRDLDLAAFVVANFNVREEETVVLHIPLVSLAMLESLFESESSSPHLASARHDRAVRSSMFHLLTLMIDMIPDRAFTVRTHASSILESPAVFQDKVTRVRAKVESFFLHNENLAEVSAPLAPAEALGRTFLQLLTPMILMQIHNDGHGTDLARSVQILPLLLTKLSSYDGLDGPALVEALKQRLDSKLQCDGRLPFALLSSATALFIALNNQDLEHQIIRSDDRAVLVPVLVEYLWGYLSYSSPQYHIESVRLLEDLQNLVWREELVTSTILSLLTGASAEDTDYQADAESLERYATLWAHSHNDLTTSKAKPTSDKVLAQAKTRDAQVQSTAAFSSMLSYSLVFVLGVLRQPDTEANAVCRDWLHSLADLSSIFEAVIARIKNLLGVDDMASASTDSLEHSSTFVALLSELIAAQSREQWIDFCEGDVNLKKSKLKGSDTESLQVQVARLCSEIIQRYALGEVEARDGQTITLQCKTLNLIRRLLRNSDSQQLLQLQIDDTLVKQLRRPAILHSSLQSELLETLLLVLNAKTKVRNLHDVAGVTLDGPDLEMRRRIKSAELKPPDDLLDCLLKGIESPSSHGLIHKWIQIVCQSAHFYPFSAANILMRVVDCFCKQIEVCFSGMKAQYLEQPSADKDFEHPLFHLLGGLDFVLTGAHERLLAKEEEVSAVESPELQQGFFGSMVSGARTSDAKQNQPTRSNNRLTVILCFQDVVRTCFNLWSWQGLESVELPVTQASFQHASQKLRIRSRRMLEHLTSAEPLECIEVFVDIWLKATVGKITVKAAPLLDLVNTLDGCQPSITMAAIFNAIYTRHNPTAIVSKQKSTLSSNLEGCDLVIFMNVYVRSLEDDVLNEIWKDCTTFLRDVLANPMPHRQILTRLVEFIAILGAKMENTNFGEEWKMRKDLADLFARLLTAIFTIKPNSETTATTATTRASGRAILIDKVGSDMIEDVLDRTFPALTQLLGDSDRLTTTVVGVVSNVIAPLFRSRLFPHNLTPGALSLFLKVSKIPNTLKAWKKELVDSFSDAKFFASAMPLVKDLWLPLLHQLASADKGLVAELLSRLSPPAAAGIMFGVGATAARLEADKKAQFNLRRLACVLLAVENDTFAGHFGAIQAKLEELLTASSVSSPSSTTRAEIYMVIRALVLKSSSSQMASFWPTINTELRAAFSSTFDSGDRSSGTYNDHSLLQAAKLLDVLLLTNSEDFQTQEWLFVTDTVDAIYPPVDRELPALIDEIALSMTSTDPPEFVSTLSGNSPALPDEHSPRGPLLSGEKTRMVAEGDIRHHLLKPFFGQLSIHTYERTYSLSDPDTQACTDDLLADLFESTIGS